jgi:hypothetical protein
MQRQIYKGKVVWIIIDDCIPVTTNSVQENFREDWTIIKAYPKPSWHPTMNTQGRNISVGINTLLKNYDKKDIEGIFIIEDDDYYKPIYLEKMVPRLFEVQAAGERNTVYYNVHYRTYFVNPNTGHSSLFQTAFTIEALPIFVKYLGEKFIDMIFWSHLTNVNLFNDSNLSIGIKGMPGRYGIGAGHTRLRHMPRDSDWHQLIRLIGIDDARLYYKYFAGDNTQRALFQRRSY